MSGDERTDNRLLTSRQRTRLHWLAVVIVLAAILGLYLIVESSHSTWVTALLLLSLLGVLGYGLLLIAPYPSTSSPRTDLGTALVAGGVIGIAVLLLQVQNSAQQQDRSAQEQRSRDHQNLLFALTSQQDLSGIDLRGRDLHDAVLRGRNLANADLRGSRLDGIDLAGVVLIGADLRGASVRDVQLDQAIWSSTTRWPSRAFAERMITRSQAIYRRAGTEAVDSRLEPWQDTIEDAITEGESVYGVNFYGSFGWSPDRPVFRFAGDQGEDTPDIDYVVFNSLVETPPYGDERAFFDLRREEDTESGSFRNVLDVQPGDVLVMRAYVHNDANSGELPDALNTRLRVVLPSGSGLSLQATAYLSADNATPRDISDSLGITSDVPIELTLMPGSARVYSKAAPSGYPTSDDIVITGAPIGSRGPDGVLGASYDDTVTIVLTVRVDAATPVTGATGREEPGWPRK